MTAVLAAAFVADERAARRDLRAQIARLERRLAELPASTPFRTTGGPHVLGVAELERVRDALFDRLRAQSDEAAQEAACTAAARVRLEALLADPGAHRHERIALRDLGLPGCGVYRARPRLGVLGRLAGWWRVTLSSGCP